MDYGITGQRAVGNVAVASQASPQSPTGRVLDLLDTQTLRLKRLADEITSTSVRFRGETPLGDCKNLSLDGYGGFLGEVSKRLQAVAELIDIIEQRAASLGEVI